MTANEEGTGVSGLGGWRSGYARRLSAARGGETVAADGAGLGRNTVSNRMRTLATRYLKYSDSTSRWSSPFDHHGSMRKRSETTGIGDQRHVRQLVRDFGERARHVVGGGDDDQRMEAAVERPAPRLHRVAEVLRAE